MECVRSRTEKGLTVYLDSRPILQIRDGTVIAVQAYGTREERFINTILKEEGLSDQYTLTPDGLVEYNKEGIKVWTIKDLASMNKL